jgi:antitoxin VapB
MQLKEACGVILVASSIRARMAEASASTCSATYRTHAPINGASGSSLALPKRKAYVLAYAKAEEPEMQHERHVRLFRNGRNQAVRIPVEFELPGDEAIMHRDGDRLIIEPIRKGGLIALLDTLDPLDEDFPAIEDKPSAPEDIF